MQGRAHRSALPQGSSVSHKLTSALSGGGSWFSAPLKYAQTPEELVFKFAAAWTNRDADALGDIFDDDADFSNEELAQRFDEEEIILAKLADRHDGKKTARDTNITAEETRVKYIFPVGSDGQPLVERKEVATIHVRWRIDSKLDVENLPFATVLKSGMCSSNMQRWSIMLFVARWEPVGWRVIAAESVSQEQKHIPLSTAAAEIQLGVQMLSMFNSRDALRSLKYKQSALPDRLPQSPEEIPALLADAWLKKDAAAFAAVFHEDADFVNVVGLWWRSRSDIQKAHEIGLRTIFRCSSLIAESCTVKYSPSLDPKAQPYVADVSILWRVDGQLELDGTAALQRWSDMMLVLQQEPTGWRVAAAHNGHHQPLELSEEDYLEASASCAQPQAKDPQTNPTLPTSLILGGKTLTAEMPSPQVPRSQQDDEPRKTSFGAMSHAEQVRLTRAWMRGGEADAVVQPSKPAPVERRKRSPKKQSTELSAEPRAAHISFAIRNELRDRRADHLYLLSQPANPVAAAEAAAAAPRSYEMPTHSANALNGVLQERPYYTPLAAPLAAAQQ